MKGAAMTRADEVQVRTLLRQDMLVLREHSANKHWQSKADKAIHPAEACTDGE